MGVSGQVTVRYSTEHGEQKVESEHIDVPSDLSNGMIDAAEERLAQKAPPKTLSLIAATPKPRLVKLAVTAAGQERFSTGGSNSVSPRITS